MLAFALDDVERSNGIFEFENVDSISPFSSKKEVSCAIAEQRTYNVAGFFLPTCAHEDTLKASLMLT